MINFTELYTLLGKTGHMFNDLNSFIGTTALTDGQAIQTLYTSDGYATLIPNLQNNLQNLTSVFQGFQSNELQTDVQTTIISVINADTPQVNTTLLPAINELIIQMLADSQSIQSNSVSISQIPYATNIGDGQLVTSLVNGNGLDIQMPYAENINLICASDAVTGSAVAGNETFQFQGTFPVVNELNYNFPQGSGAVINFPAIDALAVPIVNPSVWGTLLYNGAFQSFLSNTPTGWEIVQGAAGTEVLQAPSTIYYTGDTALELVGTGTDPILEQSFNDANGTTATLTTQPFTVLMGAFWAMTDAALGSGTLTVELYDTTDGVVIENYQAVNNSITYNLSSISHTTWTPLSFSFQTPRALPPTYAFRIIGTSIPLTHQVYIGQLAMSGALRPYPGGPFFAVYSGNVNWIAKDGWNVSVFNNYGSAWATYLERMLNLNSNNLVIPNSGSPTVPDSLLA